ncbi:hypothetical protein A3K73_02710 [Candidatus Pacearchaeota archaeon RBG_13_36_9]|nr:MAG: hypothetical protein A3K73_02710 [Candidatus Pacearchaeota archaeon RBG_13_36_9]
MEKDKRVEEVMERRMNVIIGYLKAYSGKYSINALKKKILDSGYTQGELEQALESIGLSEQLTSTLIVKPEQKEDKTSKKETVKKSKIRPASQNEVFKEIENLAEKRLEEKAGQKNQPKNVLISLWMHKNKKKLTIGAILSVVASLLLLAVYKRPIISLAGFFVFFALFFLYGYFKRILKESSRITKIESIFPDFLQLMASNLRAGMTIDRSILMSSRPEFHPLDKEIMIVGKDIATGKTLENSLLDMTKRIKSNKIEKMVFIIISGIRAGGNLSVLLEETSRNMRKREFVEKRASSNVLMYVIFIFVAAAIGAPVLFSLSTLLVETLMNTISSMQGMDSLASTSSSIPFSFGEVNISLDFIKYFSIVFIIMTDVLASLILGLVGKGEERDGIKYIIPMVLISLVLFFALRYLLAGFVVNLMG